MAAEPATAPSAPGEAPAEHAHSPEPASGSRELAQELSQAYSELGSGGDQLLDLLECERVFDKLYEALPAEIGRSTSRQEREERDYACTTLTYGEVHFGSFVEQLLRARAHGAMASNGGKFVDIGCGVGKACFAAALVHPWDVVEGIEILAGLHRVCAGLLKMWNETVRPDLPEELQRTEIRYMLGDATALAWHDADLVFANSTCFDETLMHQLAAQAMALKDNAIVITTTRRLPADGFDLLETVSTPEETEPSGYTLLPLALRA